MCNSAPDILFRMLNDNTFLCCTNHDKLGWEREYKEFGQNLRKFGSSKKEFRFQAVEALSGVFMFRMSFQSIIQLFCIHFFISKKTQAGMVQCTCISYIIIQVNVP